MKLSPPKKTGPRSTARAGIGSLAVAAVALLATSLPAVAAPAPAAPAPAAALKVSLLGTVGARCLSGTTPGGNAALTVRQKRGGKVIKTARDATGRKWRVCVKPLKAGDTLVFTKGTASSSTRVPDLRLTLDRNTSTAHGRVPKTQLDLNFMLRDTIGTGIVGFTIVNKAAEADGTFTITTPSQFATDSAILTWTSPTGLLWQRETAIPGFIVEAGSAKATVFGPIGSSQTLTLKTGGGTPRASATTTLAALGAGVTLKQSGSPVTVAVGDKVSVDGFPGELTVITEDLVVTSADGGTFDAHCQPFTRWIANTYKGSKLIHTFTGSANDLGKVGTTGAWGEPGPIPSDFKVVLDCEASDGLVQRMVAGLP